jgi:hypothetical protein
MTQPKDDLEAVRAVAAALEGFDANEQERIIRWAREKLGLSVSAQPTNPANQQQPLNPLSAAPAQSTQLSSGRDFKTFVTEKNPKNDVQFSATVAYFYRFEAPQGERKNEIKSEDLQEGCRLASRNRLKNPAQTLRNAHKLGLLDKGTERGSFTINSVGENLVAMTLPAKGRTGKVEKPNTKKGKMKSAKKKTATKK